jgi:hypothetical protein
MASLPVAEAPLVIISPLVVKGSTKAPRAVSAAPAEVAPVPPEVIGTVPKLIVTDPVPALTATGVVAARLATPARAEAKVDLRTLNVSPALTSTMASTSSSAKSASTNSVSSVIFLFVAIVNPY